MLSERRRAQLGLLAGCVILVSTLAILFQGSRDGADRPAKNGLGQVARDMAPTFSADGGAGLAALGK